MTRYPASATAGTANQFVLTAVDTTGATMPSYTGTVQFTASDGQAVLPASYTFTAVNGGVHTFSATFKTAGPETLTATDSATVKQSTLHDRRCGRGEDASASPACPRPTRRGPRRACSLRPWTPYGNTVSGYTGTVTFTSNDPAAVLPPQYTFVASDQGKHASTSPSTPSERTG